ncbi:MAG: hypothetical protein ACO3JG_14370 [Luteolibacter sp.]
MTLPPAIAARICAAAAKELAAVMLEEIEDAQLLTMQQAADLLGVSKPMARTLVGEVVNLGERTDRVELRRVKQLISERKVRA